MNKREKQREETLGDILRVAGDLFTNQGYENTSIQQIAEGCGLSKGALYHHFSSKEEVLERMCLDHYREILEAARPIIEETTSPAFERLERVISAMRGKGIEKASFVSEYLKVRHGEGNVILKDRLKKYDKQFYIAVVAPLLEEARAGGECDFSSTPEVMAVIIYQLDRGVSEEIHRIFADETEKNTEEKIKAVMDGFVYSLSRLLNKEESFIAKLIKMEEGMEFFRLVLQSKKESQ
jgi:AcrR family transcriptional regulator